MTVAGPWEREVAQTSSRVRQCVVQCMGVGACLFLAVISPARRSRSVILKTADRTVGLSGDLLRSCMSWATKLQRRDVSAMANEKCAFSDRWLRTHSSGKHQVKVCRVGRVILVVLLPLSLRKVSQNVCVSGFGVGQSASSLVCRSFVVCDSVRE